MNLNFAKWRITVCAGVSGLLLSGRADDALGVLQRALELTQGVSTRLAAWSWPTRTCASASACCRSANARRQALRSCTPSRSMQTTRR